MLCVVGVGRVCVGTPVYLFGGWMPLRQLQNLGRRCLDWGRGTVLMKVGWSVKWRWVVDGNDGG